MSAQNDGNQCGRNRIEKRLAAAGIPSHAVEAVLKVDALMQSWRRRISKRELGLSALSELGLDLELAQLDVLMAIAAPGNEFGNMPAEETMVGTVAERLMIDPSRASRLVSEMVDKHYVTRSASQLDSRRTVIGLTNEGNAVVDAVRTHKFLMLGDFLSDWSEAELHQFLPLLARFSAWSDRPDEDRRKRRFEDQFRALAEELARNRTCRPA